MGVQGLQGYLLVEHGVLRVVLCGEEGRTFVCPRRQSTSQGLDCVLHDPAQQVLRVQVCYFLAGLGNDTSCNVPELGNTVCNMVGAEEEELLPGSELAHPPCCLHHLVLAHLLSHSEHCTRVLPQLQVGPSAATLIEEGKRVLSPDRRGVFGLTAPGLVEHFPAL
eukprot:204646-Rhodomonas_salina.1